MILPLILMIHSGGSFRDLRLNNAAGALHFKVDVLRLLGSILPDLLCWLCRNSRGAFLLLCGFFVLRIRWRLSLVMIFS